ncbi:MAG: hypothetical protein ACKO23_17505, partial [Gemmataceae bacterium]
YADSDTRDFRKSTWKETQAQIGKDFISAKIENPKEGCRVFFMECEYENEGINCYLSTQVKIVGNPKK